MNKAQIKRFIKKAAGYDLPFAYYSDKDDDSWMGYTDYKYVTLFGTKFVGVTIMLNKSALAKYRQNPNEIKALLLHEIGHMKTNCHEIRCMSEQEVRAYKWSTKRAKQLGMTRVLKELEEDPIIWSQLDWNSKYRRYIMAAKKLGYEHGKRIKRPRRKFSNKRMA